MKVLLIYPPLRQLHSKKSLQALDDTDNTQVPIGVYSLGALLRQRGWEAEIENCALTPWNETLALIESHRPDVLGISCYTFHRHTVAALAKEVKKRSPEITIVVGGVHVSPIPEITLERWPFVDFIAVGESEASFPTLIERLEAGGNPAGIPGIAFRDESGQPRFSGRAEAIPDLDCLPIAAEHWTYLITSASRGCPFVCTFCSSPMVWGRRVRERSAEHVIRELEALRRAGLRAVSFKDETFTLRRARVAELCQAIIDSGVNIWWTCDTRADCVDEERLEWLRRAGCHTISLGVESGSERMIKLYNKREKPEEVIRATRLARQFGIQVRHYYIVGAPGESEESIADTMALIEESRPQQVFVSELSVLPGTQLDQMMKERHGWDDSIWFDRPEEWLLADQEKRFASLKNFGRIRERYHNSGAQASLTNLLNPFTLEELRAAAERVSDAFDCHWVLGKRLRAEGKIDEAAATLQRVVNLNPRLGSAWIELGECLLAAGKASEAFAAWERVENIDDESVQNRIVALLRRAQVMSASGEAEAALALCRQALEIDPTQVDALNLSTQIMMALKRFDEAVAVAEQWAKHHPRDARPMNVMAGCHFMRGELAEALDFFLAAGALDPNSAEAWTNTALVQFKLGQVEDARESASRSLQIEPGNRLAGQILARCH